MYRFTYCMAILFLIFSIGFSCVHADDYLPGQIILDPDHPDRLVYNRDANEDGRLDPFFICGPGGPEGFLYGDISGGDTQDTVLDQMIEYGGNCIYMQGVRSHGGDGDENQNPFVNHDPEQGIDESVLQQWEHWFDRMEEHGIVIYFYFYDDSAALGPKNKISDAENEYIQAVVDAFEHHPNLIWVIAEEYSEALSKEKVSDIAALIRETDGHNHVIANHQLTGLEFDHADNPHIDQFAMQLGVEGPSNVHQACLKALENANGQYSVNLSELNDWHSVLLSKEDRDGVRKVNWAAAITGTHIMQLGTWETGENRRPPSKAMMQDYRYVYEFMESVADLNEMTSQDHIVKTGNAWVLGKINHYIVYLLEGGRVTLDLSDTSENLKAQWYNPRTGEYNDQETIDGSKLQAFNASDNNDWVLLLERRED